MISFYIKILETANTDIISVLVIICTFSNTYTILKDQLLMLYSDDFFHVISIVCVYTHKYIVSLKLNPLLQEQLRLPILSLIYKLKIQLFSFKMCIFSF